MAWYLRLSNIIIIHAASALIAILIGLVQFSSRKGSLQHRLLGYIWILLMFIVCISSFWIHEIRLWNVFSPIHLLSIITLISLYISYSAAVKGNIKRHKNSMSAIYFMALILAGVLTLLPDRIIYQILFN